MFVDTSVLILAIVSIILGLLFAIFVVVMLWDQFSCIFEHTSTVDRLKFRRAMQSVQGMKKSDR